MAHTGTVRRPSAREPSRLLPPPAAGLSRGRRIAGLGIATAGVPGLTIVLLRVGDELALGSQLLLYALVVVAVAAVGGLFPGILSAVASVLVANWFFTVPVHTLEVEARDAVVELVVFGIVAVVVSIAVEYSARDRAHAARSRVEVELLSHVAGQPVDDLSLPQVLERVRAAFGVSAVALVHVGEGRLPSVVAAVGPIPEGEPTLRIPATAALELVVHGHGLIPEDEAVLRRLAMAAARAWEARQLAERTDRLAETEQVSAALLAAVGHDLRTPLAALKAAVSSLRQDEVTWSPEQAAELLATIDSTTDRLAALIGNLLDMSRIDAGTLTVRPAPVGADEVVGRALLDHSSGAVVVRVPDDLPLVLADAGLLERVVANLVDNAVRHSPPSVASEVHGYLDGGRVHLAVVDHGPGVPEHVWPALFAPFRHSGDRDPGGAGLGLSIVVGFCAAMGAEVQPSVTPGGGLTMTVSIPVVDP